MAHSRTASEDDIFAPLLNLESTLYAEGYTDGHADGLRASRVESHVFGVEQGFKRFVEMGELAVRIRVSDAQVRNKSEPDSGETGARAEDAKNAVSEGQTSQSRLRKHVEVLLALTDPRTLDTRNTDDAVAAFDDRLKRAKAKIRIVEKMLGESKNGSIMSDGDESVVAMKGKVGRGNTNMEDFGI